MWSFVPWSSHRRKTSSEETEEDIEFERARWGFFGLVLGSFAAYTAIVGIAQPLQTLFSGSGGTSGVEADDDGGR